MRGHNKNFKISGYRLPKVVHSYSSRISLAKELTGHSLSGIFDVATRQPRFFEKKQWFKVRICYCHQIWTVKIKSEREWHVEALRSAGKGDLLFARRNIAHTKVLIDKILQNTLGGCFYSQWRLRMVMHFKAKSCVMSKTDPTFAFFTYLFFFLSTSKTKLFTATKSR